MDSISALISNVKNALQSPIPASDETKSIIAEIEEYFHDSIPDDAKHFLINVTNFPENVADIFAGYEALTLEEIVECYRNIDGSNFFSSFNVDENFHAAKDASLRVFSTLEGEVEELREMSDMKRVIPLFSGGSGYFLCLFINENAITELSVITQDYGISSFAPSLTEHLDNMEQGLAKGIFREEGGALVMPMVWHQRVKALSPAGLVFEEWSI